ncbi:DUF2520 domain-containing protein [Microbacterium hominis]|uniref:DUF2520 domain-containing protein n=1 Tax=Microbacterium hominis TaxID=162426 RepID=A0A7D4TLM3_9MICO|nr:DUF2520 domain-containing protein [Microbacterium hominis]QKJ18382.1 DUF2520 domain-containing protein [Microbacterium hominis]
MPLSPPLPAPLREPGGVLVVGTGRMGAALAARLTDAGVRVRSTSQRGATGLDAAIVLLAVPDAAIPRAAAAVAPGRFVGHLSGATTLAPLAPHAAFSIHPLMTVTGADTSFAGVPAAIAGSDDDALAVAQALADALGLRGVEVADADRAAYHAAATIASNFLLALEDTAEQLAATAGVDRDALLPLVRATVGNWAAHGAGAALTGPIARGDVDTVRRQRDAIAARLPGRLALFDAMVDATRDLATRSVRDATSLGAAAPAVDVVREGAGS